jgi:hypothetical protein
MGHEACLYLDVTTHLSATILAKGILPISSLLVSKGCLVSKVDYGRYVMGQVYD